MLSNLSKYQIILASQSPRRKVLLAGLGVNFDTLVLDADESFSDELSKNEVAEFLSAKKGNEYLLKYQIDGKLVITADTIVYLNNKVLNKPLDVNEAFTMLSALSGRMHEVVTGVTVLTEKKKVTFSELSKVYFKTLTEAEIHYYIENFKPFDKAGSYGIQEWIGYIGIENIEGSYFNVMGLPTQKLYEVLKSF